jgi:uncharacterized protein
VSATDDEPDFRPDGADAVLLALRVAAGARRTRVVGVHGGALKLSVQAPPERGKANRQVVELVADTFALAPSEVAIVRGETAPDKTVRLPLGRAEASLRWRRARSRRASEPARA